MKLIIAITIGYLLFITLFSEKREEKIDRGAYPWYQSNKRFSKGWEDIPYFLNYIP